jgi:flagellar assembly protein FliH
MTLEPPRKFTFDTVFDGGRVIQAPRPKRNFTMEDLDAARAQGFAEGQRSVVAASEAALAASVQDVAHALQQAIGALTSLAHEHRVASAELSMACARRIANAALDKFPNAPAEAALAALASELAVEPRLIVRATAEEAERLADILTHAAESAGLSCQIVVRADPSLPRAAFGFDWGDGRAQFDPARAEVMVAQALFTALAAEGLHAEPLVME